MSGQWGCFRSGVSGATVIYRLSRENQLWRGRLNGETRGSLVHRADESCVWGVTAICVYFLSPYRLVNAPSGVNGKLSLVGCEPPQRVSVFRVCFVPSERTSLKKQSGPRAQHRNCRLCHNSRGLFCRTSRSSEVHEPRA